MKKLLGCFLCVMLLVLGAQVHALPIDIDPDTGTFDFCRYEGDQNNQNDINGVIASILGSAVELYKAEVGEGESGALATSYETEFLNAPLDPSEATITYEGGPFITDAFLLVKDGNHSPAWYLFDLTGICTSLDWNGTEQLVLSGFWPDQGAISHVTLYGGESVPEPATMFLLGTGLIGLALFGRQRFKK